MISAEAKRRHVAIDHLVDRLLHRSYHALCPPGERRDVTVVDQAEPCLERIVVRPALIVGAKEAGLFADRYLIPAVSSVSEPFWFQFECETSPRFRYGIETETGPKLLSL